MFFRVLTITGGFSKIERLYGIDERSGTSGYDIIMLNAICHMFSEEQNLEFIGRARQAHVPNRRLVVQNLILNPDKAGP